MAFQTIQFQSSFYTSFSEVLSSKIWINVWGEYIYTMSRLTIIVSLVGSLIFDNTNGFPVPIFKGSTG